MKNDFSELAAMISGQTDNSSVYDIMDRADTSHNALAEELDRITAICEVYEDFESKLYEMINDIKLPED
ncbi:MAG: hypothetical protein J1E34_03180 [Oscillospiraceae bacterium]|nr:hypothetical protein [Oscillospiraceae bacterium]